MTAAQTIVDLRAARALIVKGWTRHAYERDGRYCVRGALHAVADESGGYQAACEALVITVDGAGLSGWNDAQPSKRPVLAAIDATIARLEAQP